MNQKSHISALYCESFHATMTSYEETIIRENDTLQCAEYELCLKKTGTNFIRNKRSKFVLKTLEEKNSWKLVTSRLPDEEKNLKPPSKNI